MEVRQLMERVLIPCGENKGEIDTSFLVTTGMPKQLVLALLHGKQVTHDYAKQLEQRIKEWELSKLLMQSNKQRHLRDD